MMVAYQKGQVDFLSLTQWPPSHYKMDGDMHPGTTLNQNQDSQKNHLEQQILTKLPDVQPNVIYPVPHSPCAQMLNSDAVFSVSQCGMVDATFSNVEWLMQPFMTEGDIVIVI